VEGENVGVLQPRRELDLTQEPLGPQRVGQVGVKNFECDRPVMTEIAGEVNRGHAPTAELALDQIAVTEGIG
jgi:hypothetical protein